MPFSTALEGATLALCGLALCACAGPSGGASWRADPGPVALSTAAEPPAPDDALRPDDAVPARSERIPTAGEIFDFHPPGSRPGRWRDPFIVSYTEGPLNGYRVKTLEELHALQDHRYDLVPPSALAAR